MRAVKPYQRTSSKRQQIQRSSVTNRPFLLLGAALAVCGLSLWGYFYASSWSVIACKKFEESMAYLGFTLEDVMVEGRVRTDKTQILSLLNLKRGIPLLSLNLWEAKEKLEQISWVKTARVERKLPHTLFIHLAEKEPVVLWQNQGKTYLMDRDGECVATHEPHKYKGLPIVTGDQAPSHVGELLTLFEKFAELKPRLTCATHLRAARWDIRLDDKIDVKLPEQGAERALAYLLDLTQHHHLMKQEIRMIDMRLPGQLIFRLTPDAVAKKKGKGKDV